MPHRSLIRLVLLASATTGALSCGDASPVGPGVPRPGAQAALTGTSTGSLLSCPQSYDSVTQVIGPAGGSLMVGPHILSVNALALTTKVRITAVAPAGSVRWVRFQPDGLVFQTVAGGWGAVLLTSYKGCAVPTGTTPRIAQVNDARSILQFLPSSVTLSPTLLSLTTQYAVGVLQHFSNYAVAW
jgi:hypothetical protein